MYTLTRNNVNCIQMKKILQGLVPLALLISILPRSNQKEGLFRSFPVPLCETLETSLLKFIGEVPKGTCGFSIFVDFSTAISWVFASRICFCFEHFVVSSENLWNYFPINAADFSKYSVLSSNLSHIFSDWFCDWTL